MNEPPKSAGDNPGDANLPELLTRLGEDVLSLVDSKLSLLKIEIQEDVWSYVRNLATMSVAGVVGAVGFALINVALAFVVADLLHDTQLSSTMQHAVGFATAGLVYLVIGSALARRAWARVATHNPTPAATRAELKKDLHWIKGKSE